MEEYGNGTVFHDMDTFFTWMEEHGEDPSFHVIFRGFQSDPELLRVDLNAVFKVCWVLGNMLVIVEESNIYFDPRGRFPEFHTLIARGRHRNISIILSTQRMNEIPISFRAQATSIVTFQQTEPGDLDALERWGFDPLTVQELAPYDTDESFPVLGDHYELKGMPLEDFRPD